MKRIIFLGLGIIFLGSLIAGELKDQGKSCPMISKEGECDITRMGNKVICPVTGEKFNITRDSECAEYKLKVYFFCCPACKLKFDANPEKYLKEKAKEPAPHH